MSIAQVLSAEFICENTFIRVGVVEVVVTFSVVVVVSLCVVVVDPVVVLLISAG